MGARLQLRDAFSSPLRFITQNVTRATQQTNYYRDANGRLRDEMGRFARHARQTQESLQHIGAEAGRTQGRIVSLRGAIMAVAGGVAVKKGFDWLVQGNADMETYQNTLAVVLKSQQKAADTLAWASTFAAQTPFEIPEVVEATTKLASYGMEAQKVLGITGDMASVMGKSLDQAVEAIADAQTGELERLKEFGITKAMIEAQGAKMGATLVNKSGQITDQKAFNAALFSLMEDRYRGGMELQSKTFKGMVSNASDFIGTMGRQLGAPLFDKLKAGLGETMDWVQRLKGTGQLDAWIRNVQNAAGAAWRVMSTAGGIIGQVFVESYQVASQNVDMIAGKVRAWYAEHKPQLEAIGQSFVAAFLALQTAFDQYAVPTIDWLRNTGLPGIVDALAKVTGWIVDAAAFFVDNWGTIEPIIIGLGAAWAAYGIKVLAVSGYQKAAALATAAWTKAQLLWNVAMNANPIGLYVTAIGLLIGAGILLYQHWDTVKAKLQGVADAFTAHRGVIIGLASVLAVVFGPAIIASGVQAAAAGARFLGQYVRALLITKANAIGTAAVTSGQLVMSMITAAGQAIATGTAFTGRLVVALAAYALQGWRTVAAIGAQTLALAANALQAAASGIAWVALRTVQVVGTAVTWGMTAAQWALNAAFWANPITWVVGLIVGLIAVGVLLWKNWDTIKEKTIEVWQTVKGWISQAPDWLLAIIAPALLIVKHWDDIKNVAGVVWEAVKEAFTNMKAKVLEFGQQIMDTWASVKSFLKNPIKGTVNLIQNGTVSPAATAEVDGSHATGLARVPFNGYRAELHRGERVLTAAEARQYNASLGFQQPALSRAQMAQTMQQFQQPVIQQAVAAAPAFNPVMQLQDRQRQIVFQTPAQEEARRFDQAVHGQEAARPNTQRFAGVLGAKQQPAGPAAGNQVHIEKLVEKVEIHAAPGDDGEALYEKFINVFHRKAKDAASILSSANMGALL